jgi:hypothetical protein
MSKNKPDGKKPEGKKPEDASVQMTPVQFSPPANEDSIGNIGGFMPLRPTEFPVSIPLTIIVLTLIFATVRDISTFNHSVADINRAEAPALEILKQANKQTEYVDGLKTGLQKLAITDPTAAAIFHDFFPPEKKPQDAPKPAQDAGASASGTVTPVK